MSLTLALSALLCVGPAEGLVDRAQAELPSFGRSSPGGALRYRFRGKLLEGPSADRRLADEVRSVAPSAASLLEESARRSTVGDVTRWVLAGPALAGAATAVVLVGMGLPLGVLVGTAAQFLASMSGVAWLLAQGGAGAVGAQALVELEARALDPAQAQGDAALATLLKELRLRLVTWSLDEKGTPTLLLEGAKLDGARLSELAATERGAAAMAGVNALLAISVLGMVGLLGATTVMAILSLVGVAVSPVAWVVVCVAGVALAVATPTLSEAASGLLSEAIAAHNDRVFDLFRQRARLLDEARAAPPPPPEPQAVLFRFDDAAAR